MSLAHRYQNFGHKQDASTVMTEDRLSKIEDEKLESFEAGFQAGWDDAIKAQSETNQHVSSDLAQNLQDASFSYHEARSALIKSLQPLFSDITNVMLPAIARDAVGPHIVEQLVEMARDQVDQSIEVTIAPQNLAVIEGLLGEALKDPFVLLSDPNLGSGQVYLQVGAHEREIDLDKVVTGIAATMNAFFQHNQEDATDG